MLVNFSPTNSRQLSAWHVFRFLENSLDNMCCGIPFLQNWVCTGSLQNSCSEQLFEKLPSLLKKDSNMDVLLGRFQKFSEWLFCGNPNGQLIPKIQTSFNLEH